MKRVLNHEVLMKVILDAESKLKNVDSENKSFFFVLNNKDESLGYFAPWSSVSVSDAVFKVAKSLCVVDGESPLIKEINHLQLVLWFLGDPFSGDIVTMNYIVCDLNCLILEE